MLTIDQVRGLLPETDIVDVPDLGEVQIRSLSGAARAELFEMAKRGQAGGDDAPTALDCDRRAVVLGTVDPVLTDADVGHLYDTRPLAAAFLCQEILRLAGMGEAGEDDARKKPRRSRSS